MNEKRRVLCADDNEDTRLMLRALLGGEYEAKTARDADEAAAAAGRERFGLFVIDLRFPGVSGVDLCRRLRALQPHAPVVFHTGVCSQNDRRSALDAGAVDYVVKPEIRGLLVAVRRAIGEEAAAAPRWWCHPPCEQAGKRPRQTTTTAAGAGLRPEESTGQFV